MFTDTNLHGPLIRTHASRRILFSPGLEISGNRRLGYAFSGSRCNRRAESTAQAVCRYNAGDLRPHIWILC